MSLANVVAAVASFLKSDTVSRAIKTLVEVTAAQAALYTTVIPSAPSVQGTAAVSGSAALLAVVWNLLLTWATKTKSAKLDALAEAIDKVVDARLSEQSVPDNDTPQIPAPPAGG